MAIEHKIKCGGSSVEILEKLQSDDQSILMRLGDEYRGEDHETKYIRQNSSISYENSNGLRFKIKNTQDDSDFYGYSNVLLHDRSGRSIKMDIFCDYHVTSLDDVKIKVSGSVEDTDIISVYLFRSQYAQDASIYLSVSIKSKWQDLEHTPDNEKYRLYADSTLDFSSFPAYNVSAGEIVDSKVNIPLKDYISDNKTEKVRIDIEGTTGNYRFMKGDVELSFADLNYLLQDTPDFLVFVHNSREHRCVEIVLDGNPKSMTFLAPTIDGVYVKAHAFKVISLDGVSISSISRTDIMCESSSNKVTTLDNANDTTYPTTKAVADEIGQIRADLGEIERQIGDVELLLSKI